MPRICAYLRLLLQVVLVLQVVIQSGEVAILFVKVDWQHDIFALLLYGGILRSAAAYVHDWKLRVVHDDCYLAG